MITILVIMVIVSSAATARALPSSLEQQAHLAYNEANYTKAISIMKQLLKTDPKHSANWLTDIGSDEAELSNFTQALSSYKQALIYDPHHIGALLGIGLTLRHLGDNSTAIKYFKDAIKQPITNTTNPEFVKVEKLERAAASVYMGNYSTSVADQILKQNPSDYEALEVKSMSLSYMGKAAEALNILNTLISEGHEVPWVLDNRGINLMMLHNYIGAIENFNSSLSMEPNDTYALYNRAEATLNMDFYSQPYFIQQLERHHQPLVFKHLDAALQDLNKVLSIDPYDKDARDLKSLLIEGLKLGLLKR